LSSSRASTAIIPCDGGDKVVEDLGYAVAPAEALERALGQYQGVVEALVELSQARVDVSADVLNDEVGPEALQLGAAAQRRGSDHGPFGEFLQGFPFAGHEGVEGKVPHGVGRYRQPLG